MSVIPIIRGGSWVLYTIMLFCDRGEHDIITAWTPHTIYILVNAIYISVEGEVYCEHGQSIRLVEQCNEELLGVTGVSLGSV